MINERIFGSPISGQVRKKLEDRQRVAGEVAFGESIEAVYPDKDGKNQADLSSRTPFVRMWTSVKLIDPGKVQEVLEEVPPENALDAYYRESFPGNSQKSKRLDELRKTFPSAKYTEIDGKIYITDGVERPQVDYSSKLYIVGDYNYQTGYGSVEPNESNQADEINQGGPDSGDFFPVELQNNPLLKPQAGITSVTSETEGTLGVIKRTVVNFTVHNFEDFDKIYNRYFLKPGATVFVDFGHSSVKNLYNPQKLIDAPDIKKFLYESNVIPGYEDVDGNQVEESIENIGEVAKYQGDLEVLQGIVVDYSAKVTTNGSVECSVTLISSNNALLDFEIDDVMKRHINDILTRSTLFLGVQASLSNLPEQLDESGDFININLNLPGLEDVTRDDIALMITTPNADSSSQDITEYREKLLYLAILLISSESLTPGLTGTGNDVRGGVFVNSLDSDDIYVCWGFIEDIIINANFGFGNNGDDINEGNNLQVRLDSSNQFTTWNKIFKQRQKVLSSVPEEPPVFIYPEWWGASDPNDGEGSYNYFNKKYPKLFYNGDGDHKTIDENKKRIPIREIFVNVEIVVKAFQRNKNVRNTLNDILSDINNDSDGVFDWKIKLGEIDSELMIVDNNRPDVNQRILDSGVVETQEDIEKAEREQFQNMFIFNIMSPNSIVKDYNLEFKLPQGNIGNMYAIQGMSHENKVFPTSDMIDNAVAINSLDDDSLSIIYQPDNGGYRNLQIDSKENKDGEYFNVYDGAKYLIDNNIYKSGIIREEEDLLIGESNEQFGETGDIRGTEGTEPKQTENTKEEDQKDLIQINIEQLIAGNNKVAKSFKDYYRLKEMQEINLKARPNLLPYTLTLGTYGIGSIVPGDTFRVDYLPKQHFKNTFLQTMKVTNNINSDGWYTTLDTQYRILSDKKQKNYTNNDIEKIFLSPNVLDSLNISEGWLNAPADFDADVLNISTAGGGEGKKINDFINALKPYITRLKVKPIDELENIDLVLSFQMTKDISGFEKLYDSNTMFTNINYLLPELLGSINPNEKNTKGIFTQFISTVTGGTLTDIDGYIYLSPAEGFKPEKEYFLIINNGAPLILPGDMDTNTIKGLIDQKLKTT